MSDPAPRRVRVFLDANVLYAAALSPEGGSSRLWGLPNVHLITNEQAAKEAWENFGTQRGIAKSDPKVCRARLAELLGAVEIHPSEADPSSHLYCPWPLKDPTDVPILMGAINAACQYLLTTDYSCFGEYYGKSANGVTVLPPGRFLQLLGVVRGQ